MNGNSAVCRERKRQKALDVEKAAAELSARMKEYSMVQQKHKALSEHNQALQQRLAEKDAELAEHASVAAGSEPGQVGCHWAGARPLT